MATRLYTMTEERESSTKLPAWSKKTLFKRNAREEWHRSVTSTAGCLRPSDPLFPWVILRKHTEHYIKRKGKITAAETESKLASLIEEHEFKDIAIAACAHAMTPSSLRAFLNVDLSVSPVSYLGLDTYLQSLIAANHYSTQSVHTIEIHWAKSMLSHAKPGVAVWKYLQGICTLLQTYDAPNMSDLPGFEILARRASRDFTMQLEGMRLRCDWISAYNAVAWISQIVIDDESGIASKPGRYTPSQLMDHRFPSWRIWASWKPNLARLSLLQKVEPEKKGILVDLMELEGPDFFTTTKRCLRDGLVAQYSSAKHIVSFKSLLIEVSNGSRQELAEMLELLGTCFEFALVNGSSPLNLFIGMVIKRPVSKRAVQFLEAINKIQDGPKWVFHEAALDFCVTHDTSCGYQIDSLCHLIRAVDSLSGKDLKDLILQSYLIPAIEQCILEKQKGLISLIIQGSGWGNLITGIHSLCAAVKDSPSCYPILEPRIKAQLKALPATEELETILKIYKAASREEDRRISLGQKAGSDTIKSSIESWCTDHFGHTGTMAASPKNVVESMIRVWQSTKDKTPTNSERRSLAFLVCRVTGSDHALQCLCLDQIAGLPGGFVTCIKTLLQQSSDEARDSTAHVKEESCIDMTRILAKTEHPDIVQCWKKLLYRMIVELPYEDLIGASLRKLSTNGWSQFMGDLGALYSNVISSTKASPPFILHADLHAWAKELLEFVPALTRLEAALQDRTLVKLILRGQGWVQTGYVTQILTSLTWGMDIPAERLMQKVAGRLESRNLVEISICLDSLIFTTPEGLDACERIWDADWDNGSVQYAQTSRSTSGYYDCSSIVKSQSLAATSAEKSLTQPGLAVTTNKREYRPTAVLEVMIAGWLQDDEMLDNDKTAIEALANVLLLVCHKSRIPKEKLEAACVFWDEEEAKIFRELARLNNVKRALKAKDPIGTAELIVDIGLPDDSPLDEELSCLPIEIVGAIDKISHNQVEMSFDLDSYTKLQRRSLGIGTANTLSVRLLLDYTDQVPPGFCLHLNYNSELSGIDLEHTPWLCLPTSKEPTGRYCRGPMSPFTWQLSRIVHRTLKGAKPTLVEFHSILVRQMKCMSQLCVVCGELRPSRSTKLQRPLPCDSIACTRIWNATHLDIRLPELRNDTFAVDMVLTAVYAAAQSHNKNLLPGCPITHRSTIPTILNSLVPLNSLSQGSDISLKLRQCHKDAEALLVWALTHFRGFIATADNSLRVPSMPPGTHQFVLASGSPTQEASWATRISRPWFSSVSSMLYTDSQTTLLWHGTTLDRLPCILSEGLRVLSGTPLQRTGAVHGKGIYLADDPARSLTYTSPSVSWRHSGLNGMRVLLGCEVAGGVARAANSGVYVVNDEESVMVRYLFLLPGNAVAPVANHVMPAMRSGLSALRNGTV